MHPFDVAVMVVVFCTCLYGLYWLNNLLMNIINLEASIRRHGIKNDPEDSDS